MKPHIFAHAPSSLAMPLTVRPFHAVLRGVYVHNSLVLRIGKAQCHPRRAGLRWQSAAVASLHDNDKPYYITTPIFYVNAGAPSDAKPSLQAQLIA